MKTYLVGGAVRDKLLGIETQDRDWVVFGASPSGMRELGYRQVGKDFPVFLHPDTKEEYALARTERKIGKGHKGKSKGRKGKGKGPGASPARRYPKGGNYRGEGNGIE